LRQQLLAGKVSEIGNNLALLALQARVIGEVQLPVELRFDDLNLLLESNTISAGDLARFIEILQQRRDELLSLSLEVMRSLHDGQATGAGISPELRVNYVQQLTQLYQELEEQNAQLRLLSSQRDQAFDEFSLIQKKLNEQRVMLGTSMIQVRYIDTTTVPPGSILRTLLLYSVAVAMLTVFVSIALIIAKMIIHMWQQEVSSFEEDKNSLKS